MGYTEKSMGFWFDLALLGHIRLGDGFLCFNRLMNELFGGIIAGVGGGRVAAASREVG